MAGGESSEAGLLAAADAVLDAGVGAVCIFLSRLGRVLGRPVLMTADGIGDWGHSVLGFDPAVDRVVLVADPALPDEVGYPRAAGVHGGRLGAEQSPGLLDAVGWQPGQPAVHSGLVTGPGNPGQRLPCAGILGTGTDRLSPGPGPNSGVG